MHFCHIHGKLKIEWCDDCGRVCPCNCEEPDQLCRVKDVRFIYGEDFDKERSVSIYIHCCPTCGDVTDVSLK